MTHISSWSGAAICSASWIPRMLYNIRLYKQALVLFTLSFCSVVQGVPYGHSTKVNLFFALQIFYKFQNMKPERLKFPNIPVSPNPNTRLLLWISMWDTLYNILCTYSNSAPVTFENYSHINKFCNQIFKRLLKFQPLHIFKTQ